MEQNFNKKFTTFVYLEGLEILRFLQPSVWKLVFYGTWRLLFWCLLSTIHGVTGRSLELDVWLPRSQQSITRSYCKSLTSSLTQPTSHIITAIAIVMINLICTTRLRIERRELCGITEYTHCINQHVKASVGLQNYLDLMNIIRPNNGFLIN